MRMNIPLSFVIEECEEGGFIAYAKDPTRTKSTLRTEGNTIEELTYNINEVIEAWFTEDELKHIILKSPIRG